MALSFGFGLSQNLRDAEQRNIDKRKKNRDAFQAFMDQERKAGRPLSITDLEKQRHEITGGNFLYSQSLASDQMIESMHKAHNQGVFDDQLAQATKNIEQIETRNKAFDDSVSVNGTFEEWKESMISEKGFLGPNRETNTKMFSDMGWDDRSKWNKAQQRKRKEEIDNIFNEENFASTNQTEQQIDMNFSGQPKWLVEGLKAKLKTSNANKVSAGVSKTLGELFLKGVSTEQYINYVQRDEKGKDKFVENILLASGIDLRSITPELVKDTKTRIEAHFTNQKSVYNGKVATTFHDAMKETDTWKKFHEANKNGNMKLTRTLWEQAYREAARKLGFDEKTLFVEGEGDYKGQLVLNKKLGDIIGYNNYNAWLNLNYQQNYEYNKAKGQAAATAYGEANITQDKSKENIMMFFTAFGEEKDNPYLNGPTKNIIGALQSKYYLPLEVMNNLHAELDAVKDRVNERPEDALVLAEEIASKLNLQNYSDARATAKQQYTNLFTDGVPPGTSIKAYGIEYNKEIEKKEAQITELISKLPKSAKTEIQFANGETQVIWNDPNVARLINEYKDKLLMIKKDISRDLTGYNLGAFDDSNNTGLAIEHTFGDVKVTNVKEYREYLLGKIDQLTSEKGLKEINDIVPTGENNAIFNSDNVASVNNLSFKGDIKAQAQHLNSVHGNKAYTYKTTIGDMSPAGQGNTSFLLTDKKSDQIVINNIYTENGVAKLFSSGTTGPNLGNTPFFDIFKMTYKTHNLGQFETFNEIPKTKQNEIINAMANGILYNYNIHDKGVSPGYNMATVASNNGLTMGGFGGASNIREFIRKMHEPDAFVLNNKQKVINSQATKVQLELFIKQYLNAGMAFANDDRTGIKELLMAK